MFTVLCLLTSKSVMKTKKSNNHQGHTSGKSETLRRTSGRSSGGIPQGGIVVTGGDSSTLVTAPETFSWDRIWKWEALIWWPGPVQAHANVYVLVLKFQKQRKKKLLVKKAFRRTYLFIFYSCTMCLYFKLSVIMRVKELKNYIVKKVMVDQG